MEFVLIPTLKHIAVAKVVINLFGGPEIGPLLQSLPFPQNYIHINPKTHREIMEVTFKTRKLLTILPIPKLFISKLASFIRPMAFQIFRWFHHLHFDYEVKGRHPRELRWTADGKIDKVRSVELLSTDPSLKLKTRYRLACDYCLVDRIHLLFIEQMARADGHFPRIRRTRFVAGKELTEFWTRSIRTGQSEANWDAFRRCVLHGNSAGAEYFFHRLTAEEQMTALYEAVDLVRECRRNSPTVISDSFAQIVRFLLCRMNHFQRSEMFGVCRQIVIAHFFAWPYRRFFGENVNRVWEFIGEDSFYYLLGVLFEDIEHEREECLTREVFREFWSSSPEDYKRHAFSDRHFVDRALYTYWGYEEIDICRLMLDEATVEEKEEMILGEKSPDIRHLIFHRTRGDFLQFFVQQFVSSEESVEKFKTFFGNLRVDTRYESERKGFVQFLNNFNPGSKND